MLHEPVHRSTGYDTAIYAGNILQREQTSIEHEINTHSSKEGHCTLDFNAEQKRVERESPAKALATKIPGGIYRAAF